MKESESQNIHESRQTDIDFVSNYNNEYGIKYKNAKNLYEDAPIQTLVELRALTLKLCFHTAEFLNINIKQDEQRLFSLIKKLEQTKIVNKELTVNLDLIRIAGNKAAHNYEFKLKIEEFKNIAIDTLKAFCVVIKHLYSYVKGVEPPNYIFTEQIESSIRELSYKVLFENDISAMYIIGKALLDKHCKELSDKFDQSKKFLFYHDDKEFASKAVDLLEKAALHTVSKKMFLG